MSVGCVPRARTQSQGLDGFCREHQVRGLGCTCRPFEEDLPVSRGRGASVSRALVVLVSGSTTPVGRVQRSRMRGERRKESSVGTSGSGASRKGCVAKE